VPRLFGPTRCLIGLMAIAHALVAERGAQCGCNKFLL
jgi:hypothetical protein